jgi:hypothetical protein
LAYVVALKGQTITTRIPRILVMAGNPKQKHEKESEKA